MPLSLQYGYDVMSDFLKGAHSIDKHVLTTPLEKNIPALLGLWVSELYIFGSQEELYSYVDYFRVSTPNTNITHQQVRPSITSISRTYSASRYGE